MVTSPRMKGRVFGTCLGRFAIALAVLSSCFKNTTQSTSETEVRTRDTDIGVEARPSTLSEYLLVELSSFDTDVTHHFVLEEGGELLSIEFSPTGIRSLRGMQWPADDAREEISAIHAAIETANLRIADSDAIDHGDRLLLATSQEGTPRQHAGLLKKAPGEIRDLISRLERASDEFIPLDPADLYMRGHALAASRQEWLVSRGMVTPIQLDQLTPSIRDIVSETLDQPWRFRAIDQSQLNELLQSAATGHDLFVERNATWHQLNFVRSN